MTNINPSRTNTKVPGSTPRPRGRPFEKGNNGRKRGSKNKTTVIAQALAQGQAEELVRKGIELALAGDTQMLKFLLDRVLPRERLISIKLPLLDYADDAVDALAAVVRAVSEGEITLGEAAQLASLISAHVRVINVTELSVQFNALKEKLESDGWRHEQHNPSTA